MTSKQRIEAFSALGQYLKRNDDLLQELIIQAQVQNPWFTITNLNSAILSIAENLDCTLLDQWLSSYSANFDGYQNKTVGLVLAGNIPMVGFHDILCTLITGFNVQIKLSTDDKILLQHILDKLREIEPQFKKQITIVDRLKDFDIVIATGSNNTSRYFEYYFKDVPHIIRKNRNGLAILTGEENDEELEALGHDIFDYFGLGCRNVSKIYFPKGYNYSRFFEGIESYHDIANHFKYHNNYEYNKSIYLINGDEHLDNGFILLKKDERLASPLAVIYFEEYDHLQDLKPVLEEKKQEIQCIVGSVDLGESLSIVPFGQSQSPKLSDYADGVDLIEFLIRQIDMEIPH